MVTISDVAKRAGVSPVTVSRVVNHTDYVSAKTREKVEKVIIEMGYIPSAMARGLRINRTFTFALILPDITNPFWTTVVRGVEDAAQLSDYSILLYNVDEDRKKQKRAIETVLSQQVDGIMIAPHDGEAANLAALYQRNVPTVIIDRKLGGSQPEWSVDAVRSDSVSGAKALTEHLIRLGHRKIGMLSGDKSTSTAQDRVQGYRLALEDAGIPVDEELIFYGEYRVASGENLTRELLESKQEFTSIFAANNAIGMGVIRELIHRNIRVPEDMALVFYDDYANAGEYFPFFTVVTQNAYEIGTTAAELLISRVTGQHVQPREVVLSSQLVVRYSCGSRINQHGVSPLSLPILRPKDLKEDITEIDPE